MITRAAARNFPRGNFCFARPIRFVISGEVMQIVQARRGHAGRPIWKIKRNRFRFDAHPAIDIAAVRAELSVTKKQVARFEQGKTIRISDHGIGQFTRWGAN